MPLPEKRFHLRSGGLCRVVTRLPRTLSPGCVLCACGRNGRRDQDVRFGQFVLCHQTTLDLHGPQHDGHDRSCGIAGTVTVDVYRDDDVGTHGPRHADGHDRRDSAVHEHTVPVSHRHKDAGDRRGRSRGLACVPLRQDDGGGTLEVTRYGCKSLRKTFDGLACHKRVDRCRAPSRSCWKFPRRTSPEARTTGQAARNSMTVSSDRSKRSAGKRPWHPVVLVSFPVYFVTHSRDGTPWSVRGRIYRGSRADTSFRP